jgi:sporulation protein YlmC with PRC-barrel domain
MDIPIDAEVICSDGNCGQVTYVIIDPTTEKITHVVVRERHFPNEERLVPLDFVGDTTSDSLHLNCDQNHLARMQRFIKHEFMETSVPFESYASSRYLLWPYDIPEEHLVDIKHEQIPPGELAVRRGAQVIAKDGPVGRVDEFLIDPASGSVTHVILREGHLWGQKDVVIPVSQIDHVMENSVYLKLDKKRIESLPAVPVKRWI